MPNWNYNILRCEGISEMDIFTEKDEKKEFDFNKLTPRPECLNKTVSPVKCNAILAYFAKICPTLPIAKLCDTVNKLVTSHIRFCNGVNKEQIIAMSETELNELFLEEYNVNEGITLSATELGEAYIQAFQETGCFDWHEWSKKYWGVKWNASDTEVDNSEIRFYTPWSAPMPVVVALSLKYPEKEFYFETYFEGEAIESYSCHIKNGEIYDEYTVGALLEENNDE